MKRSLLFVLTRIVPIAIGIAFASCKNTSSDLDQAPQTEYALPMVQPLKLSKPKKIDLDGVKAVSAHPLVKSFDLDKLPAQSYDTAGFKPFKYPVEEAKLDIEALPAKDLDIDKLPSRSLKFKTEKLPPPRLIHSGPPHLKDVNLSLFELEEVQGLIGSQVSCLFTDRDGFLWIANNQGLYRYDGENLLLYIAGGLEGNHLIWSMLQDSSGSIWMGTLGAGLEVLDPRAGTLKKTDRSMGLSTNNVPWIMQDSRQRIWLSFGINIIDPKTQTVKWLDGAHGLADTANTQEMMQDKEGRIWITSNKGVKVIDLIKEKIRFLNKANGLKSDTVVGLFSDRAGHIWLGVRGGILNVLDLQKGTIQTIKEAQHANTDILSILQDKKGQIWAGTFGNGLEIIDPEKQLAMSLKKDQGLNGNSPLHLNQDSQGQVWIGNLDGGLSMTINDGTVIEHIGKAQLNLLAEDSKGLIWDEIGNNGFELIDRKNKTTRHLAAKQGLSNDSVTQFFEKNGKLFIPGFGGLDIINRAEKTISHIGKDQGLIGIANGIAADKEGRLWLGGPYGLSIYDPKTNTVKHIGKSEYLDGRDIGNMQTDAKGRIWISTNSGRVDVIDPYAQTVQNLNKNGIDFSDGGSGGGILLADKRGNMWIGTNHGIYIADIQNKTLITFSVPQGLIDERIATLLQRDNKIYTGTVGGITVITPPAEGIVTNKKWSVWSFGGEYGLKKLNPGYGLTDALSSDGHFLFGDQGITVLDLSRKDTIRRQAYISGMNIIDRPANFTSGSHTVSNGLVWDGISGPFNLPVNLQLPHDQNYLQFNFTTLNFMVRGTTWYQYRLIGKDTSWSKKTTADHSLNYFSLPPGTYTFEVVSKSSDNGWSAPASFIFVITPPWWLTWWAYLSYAVLFAGIIWSFAHFRSLQLVREKRVLEQKVHLRTEEVLQQKEEIEAQRDNLEKAFKELKNTQTQLIQSEKMASLGELTAGIAHEIQNPLNFVNNFSEVNTELIEEMQQEIDNGNYEDVKAIAVDIKENQQKINQHGKRADFIVKGMLQHSRSGSGERQLTNINVLAGEFFKLSFQGLRAKDKSFNSEMVTHLDKTIPEINIVQQDIGRVLLNLFNNAFYAVNQKKKTAGDEYKPEVTVTTVKEKGQVNISVKDNGIGIPDAIKEKIMQPFFTTKPTGEGTGLGLSLTYDMVVKGHGGSINVNSKEGEGSEFMISLPI